MNLFALHGFLGKALDWHGILPAESTHFIDLYSCILPFPQWAKAFNSYARKTCETKKILIGYSLGGRLALHALLENPPLWQGAVIISANTGAANKEERLVADEKWATRFESESWDTLMHAWNQQPLFGGFKLKRQEKGFSRAALAKALRIWSLARQENVKEKIQELSLPILWVGGKKDPKWAQDLSFSHPLSSIWSANTFHRVPWEATQSFREQLQLFLEKIGKVENV